MAGSLVNMWAQKKAAGVQARAMASAGDLQMQQYQQTRADLAPWRETGGDALNALRALYLGEEGPDYSEFFKSPGYDFRFGEGVRAIDRSAAARGRLMSGATGRELTRYGQGVASSEFNTYANRLAALAGLGQTSAAQTGQLGAQAAGIAGGHIANAGTARASGYSALGNISQAAWDKHEGRAYETFSGAGGMMAGMMGGGGGGGGGMLAMMSSRDVKEDKKPIEPNALLNAIEKLPVETWNYKADAGKKKHIGPYAEDFKKAFGVGDGETIQYVDAFGVLFGGVNALAGRVRELEAMKEAA